jgi:hypothetical protein
VGPRAGLDWCGKSRLPTGIRSRDRPARSDSLRRLSDPAPIFAEYFDVSRISVEVLLSPSVPQTSERALICSKVFGLRPLFLVTAVVLIWRWLWNIGGMILKGKTDVLREKTCPCVTSSTTGPTWSNLGSNPWFRGGRPANNRLSHGTTDLYLGSFYASYREPNNKHAGISSVRRAYCYKYVR